MDRDDDPPALPEDALDAVDASTASPGRSDDEWREIVRAYVEGGARQADWPLPVSVYGLPPQRGNASRVPQHIRREAGFDG
jgi:hypothetical protein